MTDRFVEQVEKVIEAVTRDESGILIGGQWVGGNGGLLSRETLLEVDVLRQMLIERRTLAVGLIDGEMKDV